MTIFELEHVGCLRAAQDEHSELMREWRNAPNVRANMYSQHEITRSDHRIWWEKIKISTRDQYFIFEHDDVPLGVVAFNDIDPLHQTAFWAFYAAPEAPKGTGSRMETIALEYGFSRLGLNKLCCEVLEFNTAVVALHKKFGFEEEGFFKDQRRIGTRFVSVHRLAITASRWSTLRADFLPTPHAEG